jgi:hypothetical protein
MVEYIPDIVAIGLSVYALARTFYVERRLSMMISEASDLVFDSEYGKAIKSVAPNQHVPIRPGGKNVVPNP